MVLTRRTLGPLSSLLIAAGLVACGGRSVSATDEITEAEARDAGTGMDGLVGSRDSTADEAASPTNGEGPGANDASAAVAEDETGGETCDRSPSTSSGQADGADASVDTSVDSEPSDE